MRIADVMTRPVETTRPGATLQEAARQMREAGVGSLPVYEEERLLGMITDRDIVVRAVALARDPARTPVREAMTAQAFCVREDEPLSRAVREMEARAVRRLVVLDAWGRPVGIVSVDDLAVAGDDRAAEVLERASEPAGRPG